jgi:hypothetical protein
MKVVQGMVMDARELLNVLVGAEIGAAFKHQLGVILEIQASNFTVATGRRNGLAAGCYQFFQRALIHTGVALRHEVTGEQRQPMHKPAVEEPAQLGDVATTKGQRCQAQVSAENRPRLDDDGQYKHEVELASHQGVRGFAGAWKMRENIGYGFELSTAADRCAEGFGADVGRGLHGPAIRQTRKAGGENHGRRHREHGLASSAASTAPLPAARFALGLPLAGILGLPRLGSVRAEMKAGIESWHGLGSFQS